MEATLTLTVVGEHANLASKEEISAGINAAFAVFAEHNADPMECAAANDKLERNELITREEALLCAIWDTADDKAFRTITVGWLFRAIDIRLAVA